MENLAVSRGTKIGVTGGSGFIGSHLVRKLLDYGHDVTVLDLRKPEDDVKWVHLDFLNFDEVKKCLGLDVVYHLGAIADANLAMKQPLLAVKVNVEGTANILEGCKFNRVSRVIYASTVWVYNASDEVNVDERTLLSPSCKHVYTTTKLFGESLCHDYHDSYGLDYTVLRFGIPYGPRGRFNVIPVFIEKALLGEPLIIRGTGEQTRSFVYVEDLVLGCMSALKEEAKNKTYNLSGNKKTSVNEIAEIIKRYIGDVKIVHVPERQGELVDRNISIEKARRELGWAPTTDIDEGIRKTIEWYRARLMHH